MRRFQWHSDGMFDEPEGYYVAYQDVVGLLTENEQMKEAILQQTKDHANEKHCTCVPALRAEIAALQAEMVMRGKSWVESAGVFVEERKTLKQAHARLQAVNKGLAEALNIIVDMTDPSCETCSKVDVVVDKALAAAKDKP